MSHYMRVGCLVCGCHCSTYRYYIRRLSVAMRLLPYPRYCIINTVGGSLFRSDSFTAVWNTSK